jgi:asparagine synthase (glutamine-hydrolysing)
MCGIWASINTPDAVAGLEAASHRGPDGEGWARFDTPAGRLELGHKRLAVYDPTPDSAQPFRSSDGRYTLIFNGAIYNYRPLRENLSANGHVFETDGDVEVFLKAFMEWGTDCFARIDGMFAAVLFDAASNLLTLARDRFGEKPLYEREWPNSRWACASEIRQLSAAASDAGRLDPAILSAFLANGYVGAGSFFHDIQPLPAASLIHIDLSQPTIERHGPQAFWKPPALGRLDEAEAYEALRRAMDEAVSRLLVADVPVGACVSGGLDSSIILGTAERLRADGSDPFICVSAIFDDADEQGRSLSERPFVEEVVLGRNIELIEVSPDETAVADRLDDIIRIQGEPFPGTSICAQFFVFEAARKAGVKVMLDGQGADELFAGYAPMTGHALADRLACLDPGVLPEFIELGRAPTDTGYASLARMTWRSLISERLRRAVLGVLGRWPGPGAVKLPVFADPFRQETGLSRLDTFIRLLAREAHLPGLLRYEDRNAMAFAVETRLPFLSRAVGDLAFAIPGELKVKNGYSKYVLRKAFEDRLPAEIAWRRKKLGFVTPQQKWMRGRVGEWVDQHLDAAIETFRPILNESWIESELARKASGATPDDTSFRVAMAGRWAELTGARL